MLGWLALILAGLAGLIFFLSGNHSAVEEIPIEYVIALILGVLAILYFVALRPRAVREVGERRRLLGWLGVTGGALALIGGGLYLSGGDTLPDFGSARQAKPTLDQQGAVSVLIRRDRNGTFVGRGKINSTPATFLIDTGAAAVTLKYSDAEAAGVDMAGLSFSTPVQTANGTVYAAPIRLRSVSVGLLEVDDLEALVAKPGTLNENLLGMSFLRRLSLYTMKGDFLTLRQ